MAGVFSAAVLADVVGTTALTSFLGDAIGGTILEGAVGGGLAEFAGSAGLDAAGGAFADAAGGGLADYGSANAFADAAAGGYGGDAVGSLAAPEAGSANSYADYAAGGAGGSGDVSATSGLGGTQPGIGQVAQYGKMGMSALNGLMGSTVGSGLIGANGAQQAAATQARAATQAINLQTGMFNSSQANLQPFISGGAQAMGSLNGKLADGSLGGTFSGADYLANKDPGYQFQLDQGNQALQNSQAAKDGVLGGSSLKGLIDYNQGMASTGYQSAYNRWLSTQQNTYSQLAGTAGIGAGAANTGAQSAAKFADAIGGNITGRGNSLAAGQSGAAKNYSQALDGVGNQMFALRDLSGRSQSAYDSGYNGQNNSNNQQALDDKMREST